MNFNRKAIAVAGFLSAAAVSYGCEAKRGEAPQNFYDNHHLTKGAEFLNVTQYTALCELSNGLSKAYYHEDLVSYFHRLVEGGQIRIAQQSNGTRGDVVIEGFDLTVPIQPDPGYSVTFGDGEGGDFNYFHHAVIPILVALDKRMRGLSEAWSDAIAVQNVKNASLICNHDEGTVVEQD